MPTASLSDSLAEIRAALLADDLVEARVSGARRGASTRWQRVELRPVDLVAGPHLQVVTYDGTQAVTTNHPVGAAEAAIDALLAEPYASWSVRTSSQRLGLQVTRKGAGLVHRHAAEPEAPDRAHDRAKQHLLDPAAPFLHALGLTDDHGRVKPSRQAKLRQVEEFCRRLDETLRRAGADGALAPATAERPRRLVDLGCGNAYLTLAAHHLLAEQQGQPVDVLGVDAKQQSLEHGTEVAERLGWAPSLRFRAARIDQLDLGETPDVVLALHACDTATDDALATAVGLRAPVVLAAPCCHHDLQTRLRAASPPPGLASVARHGILRERLADVLTDAVRASLLRRAGYRVDVVEFVGSEHTPRNTLLRAVRSDHPATRAEGAREYDAFTAQWGVRPRLAELLDAGR